MIDFDRPGETKYEHDKLYEVILMYITDATAHNEQGLKKGGTSVLTHPLSHRAL
jgi:hypothetical protein